MLAECWSVKNSQVQKIKVAEMRMNRWIYGHIRRDTLGNEDIQGQGGGDIHARQDARSETAMIWACEEEEHKYPNKNVPEVENDRSKER